MREQKHRAERVPPDCATCIYRGECGKAEAGKFCAQWRSREPEDRGPNPSEQWARGEDADLGG